MAAEIHAVRKAVDLRLHPLGDFQLTIEMSGEGRRLIGYDRLLGGRFSVPLTEPLVGRELRQMILEDLIHMHHAASRLHTPLAKKAEGYLAAMDDQRATPVGEGFA